MPRFGCSQPGQLYGNYSKSPHPVQAGWGDTNLMDGSHSKQTFFVVFYKKDSTILVSLAGISFSSAKLHSYCFRLWLNYGYGKKKVVFPEENDLFPGKRKKERNDYEEQQPDQCSSGS
jgi:hypothetical protein